MEAILMSFWTTFTIFCRIFMMSETIIIKFNTSLKIFLQFLDCFDNFYDILNNFQKISTYFQRFFRTYSHRNFDNFLAIATISRILFPNQRKPHRDPTQRPTSHSPANFSKPSSSTSPLWQITLAHVEFDIVFVGAADVRSSSVS